MEIEVIKVAESDGKCCKCGQHCMKCECWLVGISDPFNLRKKEQKENEITSEFGCSIPVRFSTSSGIKTMIPGKTYDENLNEISNQES